MTKPRTPCTQHALLLLPSLALLLLSSSAARAQAADDPFAPGGSMGSTSIVEKPTGTTEPPAPVPPANAVPEESSSIGPVERLPPTAYPEWKTRGLYGGSLWFSGNMNGMPWPYFPRTGIGVSGYAWIDSGYEQIKRGNVTEANDKDLVSQGRALLRITPTYSRNGWYVQAQTEFVANKDQSVAQPNVVDIDDLWVRLGEWHKWDVEIGRYEGFEVYHFGMGMDLNTLERLGATDRSIHAVPDVFEIASPGSSNASANIVYRQSGITNVALHAYPTDSLRFELLGQFGFDTASAIDTVGVRPAAVFDLGWLKLKGALDAREQFPVASTSKERRFVRGGTAAVQFVFDPLVEFGANFALGLIDHWLPANSSNPSASRGDFDPLGSVTDLDFGGWINLRVAEGLLVGGGGNYDQETDQQSGQFTHIQAFGAIQYLVRKQLFVKLVAAYARAHIAIGGGNPPAFDNTMESARLRVEYLF